MAKLNLLIGHRGVGKSSLLSRIETYFSDNQGPVKILDLDDFIAQGEGKSIQEIWNECGESHFRNLEREYFRKITESLKESADDIEVFLAVGAGFEDSSLVDFDTVWVRRITDSQGRIFLNRPRLNRHCDPLTEYQERFPSRNSYYKKVCKKILTLPEGFDQPYEEEKNWFLNKIENLKGSMLYNPTFASTDWIKTRLRWGVTHFELRDDLLTPSQLENALSLIPRENVLLSFRSPQASFRDEFIASPLAKVLFWDWALEVGSPEGNPSIISYHGGWDRDSQDRLQKIELRFPASLIKWAPLTDSWQDLMTGHQWFLARPKSRVFLPRSTGGRWVWYRLYLRDKARLNFFREDEGASDDQPLLLEWSMMSRFQKPIAAFAAILGDPVTHSRTCAEHFDFFAKRDLPVFRIPLAREEWNSDVFLFLESLGMKYAAVTSPLKAVVFQSMTQLSDRAQNFQSVNTLVKQKTRQWHGDFTDIEGLSVLLENVPDDETTAVWGGGGLLSALKMLLPHAQYYSAQTGERRRATSDTVAISSQAFKKDSPKRVIWAAGNYGKHWPPPDWRPTEIIDLSYSDDSPGRLYALDRGAKYRSGMMLFREQAKEQRDFWVRNEC